MNVNVCARLGWIKGTDESAGKGKATRAKLYEAAKCQGNYDAAATLVAAAMDEHPACLDSLIDLCVPHVERGTNILFAVPHPPFADENCDGADLVGSLAVRNALPLQYASSLASIIGGDFCYEIVQKARVGRTAMTRFARYLWQPAFDGRVDVNAAYVLVDDVFTMGGTLAALRSHIVAGGATVIGVTALAHKTGRSQPLALQAATWDRLVNIFGPEFASFWAREIGHDAQCLTEAEGRGLLDWAGGEGRSGGGTLLQRLRDRLASASATGS